MIFPSTLIISASPSKIQKKIKSLCLQLKNPLTQNNPDIQKIGHQKPGTIKEVRQLKNFLSQKPFQHSNKIAIIYHLNQLSLPAQNALLKTVEEPGRNNFLILTATSSGQLLPTIISRCQVLLSTPKIENQLSQIPSFINPSTALNFSQQQKKEEILPLLQNQLISLKQQLVQNPNIQIANQIQGLATAIDMIRHNVDPVSALDFFLLTF